MTNPVTAEDVAEQLNALEQQVRALDWRAPVPDDLQSEVRMLFNEALAGGPNMNGDAGPTLTPNHALDCIWAVRRIQSLSSTPSDTGDELWEAAEFAVRKIRPLIDQGEDAIWRPAVAAMDALTAALSKAPQLTGDELRLERFGDPHAGIIAEVVTSKAPQATRSDGEIE
jgi:hypothetical protein